MEIFLYPFNFVFGVNQMKNHYTKVGKQLKKFVGNIKSSRTTYYNWEKLYTVKRTAKKKTFAYKDVQILEERNYGILLTSIIKIGCPHKSKIREVSIQIIHL